jgi:oxaloacetate decarboxylase alpha subunit
MKKPLAITELVLRDSAQSLLATRVRIDDMLPVCEKIDKAGFWSVELWGGATFDACIRYLGEDPWERLRRFRKALPNTKTQMLLRGQNMLGYRHYADDVVDAFVEKAAENGMDVFRVFDAMNDVRNVEAAVRAVLKTDSHAQGAMSYTISPVHTMDKWIDLGKRLEDMGCHSVCIKDMAGLIKPYVAEEMVSRLKETLSAPIALHSHATTGMSTAAIVKAVEAGVDMADAAISSMSHTYGHSATESVVAILEGGDRDTGLDLGLLEEIAAYFRGVRKKYAKFEGSLRGIDARILTAQVPGGMLTNMENQLREQDATDRFDEVLEEMPSVRKELGFIPLVTPTSQIVGTQSIVNVLSGERYKTITRQTAGVLRGEYGRTPAPVDADLQKRVLEGDDPVTCRPADLLSPEMGKLTAEVDGLAREEGFRRAGDPVEDVLTYALFGQVGLKFLKHRNDPSAFEPPPWQDAPSPPPAAAPAAAPVADAGPVRYRVNVNGTAYDVEVSPEGAVDSIQPAGAPVPAPVSAPAPAPAPVSTPSGTGEPLASPLSGTVRAVRVQPGQAVAAGDVVLVLEAMKMETNVSATRAGRIVSIAVQESSQVRKGDPLLYIS